jgi:putative endonuclease
MASRRNGTLYIGVTANIYDRANAHRRSRGSTFTKRYGIHLLVWFEHHERIANAIQRETSLKRWPRKWKLDLIEKENPDWRDLFDDLVKPPKTKSR